MKDSFQGILSFFGWGFLPRWFFISFLLVCWGDNWGLLPLTTRTPPLFESWEGALVCAEIGGRSWGQDKKDHDFIAYFVPRNCIVYECVNPILSSPKTARRYHLSLLWFRDKENLVLQKSWEAFVMWSRRINWGLISFQSPGAWLTASRPCKALENATIKSSEPESNCTSTEYRRCPSPVGKILLVAYSLSLPPRTLGQVSLGMALSRDILPSVEGLLSLFFRDRLWKGGQEKDIIEKQAFKMDVKWPFLSLKRGCPSSRTESPDQSAESCLGVDFH